MADDFDFWQDHSEEFLVNAYLHERRKSMDDPDGTASKTGDCGDSITIYLSVDNGLLQQLTFELDGCMNTNACCNCLAGMVEGKDVEDCWEITPQSVIDYLKTLPEDHYHCAELAVGTFYLALAEYGAVKPE
jgi:nitrogen fixation NifU-like protein